MSLSKIHLDSVGRVILTGTDGDDYIRGDALSLGDGNGRYTNDNTQLGGAGNDTLETGASGATDWQSLFSQSGDDTYLIGSDGGSVFIQNRTEQR